MIELASETVALLMAVAFVAGAVDAMAGGGGLLTIPALLAAGLPPVAAIATNKVQSSFGTASAVAAFARAGRIDLRRFAWPTLAAFVGSAIGAWVLTRVDPSFLGGLIPLLLIAMAVYFLLAPKASDEDRHARFGPVAMLLVIGGIGAYDGFFGPGTGSFLTLALVALFGLGIVSATAHTKLFNLASNLAAVAVLVVGGHVMWLVALAMAVASILGAQLGARLALRYGGRAVRPLLVVMSLALTAKLLADPDNPLRVAIDAF